MDEPTPLPVLEYLRRLLAGTLRSIDTTHLRYPTARASHSGRTISHYNCDIVRGDGKTIATVTSAVMTLSGESAKGR